jgi:hypothetical protein
MGGFGFLEYPPYICIILFTTLKNNMRNSKEWIAVLNGTRIDSNGFYCSEFFRRTCVTSYNKKEAVRLLSKAKMHYFGTYKIPKEVRMRTGIISN